MTVNDAAGNEMLNRVRHASLNEFRREVVNVLEHLVAGQGQVAQDLDAMKSMHLLTEALVQRERFRAKGIDTVNIRADQLPLFCVGFNAPESKSGYSWTGPDLRSYLPIAVDRRHPSVLTVDIVDNDAAHAFTEMRADGNALSEEKRWTENGKIKIRYTLPANKTVTMTMLELVTHEVFRPKDRNPKSLDSRQLGVLFAGLQIVPAAQDADQPAADTKEPHTV